MDGFLHRGNGREYIQAAPWVRGYVVASTTLPSAMAAGPTTREARRSSQASIATWKHDSLRRSIACRENPLARTLAHPAGSRSPRQSSGDSLNRDRAGVYYVTWRAASAYRGYNRTFRPTSTPLRRKIRASRK